MSAHYDGWKKADDTYSEYVLTEEQNDSMDVNMAQSSSAERTSRSRPFVRTTRRKLALPAATSV